MIAKLLAGLPAALRIAATLLLAGAAGWMADAARWPLPWMLGPLFAVAGASLAGARPQALPGGRKLGQWAIGTALGLYFTPDVIALLAEHSLLVLGAAFGSLFLGILCARVTLRLGGVDAPTAFFASLPGGASEMANLAERWGGAVDRIAAAHAVRILLVVSVVPFGLSLAGVHGSDAYALLARSVDAERFPLLLAASLGGVAAFSRLGIANAWVLGPLAGVAFLTALGAPLSALPAWLVNGGQLLIACSFGPRFSRQFFRAAPRFMATVALTSALSLGLAFALALLLGRLSGAPLATLALATAPGGVAEMCITAKVLHLGVPLVTTCHVLRVVVLTLGAQWAYRTFGSSPA